MKQTPESVEDRKGVVDAVLWCPQCFEQHIDEAKPDVCEDCGHKKQHHLPGTDVSTCERFNPWLNPPHKSHRCNFCNHVWRPAECATNGVLNLAKQGQRDGSAKPVAFANGKDFDDAVNIATATATARIAELENQVAAGKALLDMAYHIDLSNDQSITQMPDDSWVIWDDSDNSVPPNHPRYDTALEAFTVLTGREKQQ